MSFSAVGSVDSAGVPGRAATGPPPAVAGTSASTAGAALEPGQSQPRQRKAFFHPGRLARCSARTKPKTRRPATRYHGPARVVQVGEGWRPNHSPACRLLIESIGMIRWLPTTARHLELNTRSVQGNAV